MGWISDSVREGLEEANAEMMGAIAPYLYPGETVEFAEKCKQTSLFWRIFPFTPSFMIKKSLLVLTPQRLLVLRLRSISLRSYSVKKAKELDRGEVAAVKPRQGILTSSLVIRDLRGKKWPFYNLFKSSADEVADLLMPSASGAVRGRPRVGVS